MLLSIRYNSDIIKHTFNIPKADIIMGIIYIKYL